MVEALQDEIITFLVMLPINCLKILKNLSSMANITISGNCYTL